MKQIMLGNQGKIVTMLDGFNGRILKLEEERREVKMLIGALGQKIPLVQMIYKGSFEC